MHPEDRIADGAILPPFLLLQGNDDIIVPVNGAERFVEILKKYKAVYGLAEGKDESEVLKLIIKPGGHGFDSSTIDNEEYLRESVTFVEKHWLE